jgi:hypothetical protein
LVYAGWLRDFWEPFTWYLRVEEGLPATYFIIPFKGRAGERVPGRHASRRACGYELSELRPAIARLLNAGSEVAVHGIDAWHDEVKGRAERARIADVTGRQVAGIRMHWLLSDEKTPGTLERAGYTYDSTAGYNEAVGYRNGTSQAYRPPGTKTLLELPMHIQDGALFYPQRLDLSEKDAWTRCRALIDASTRYGGVLTLIWHDRSHGPERFWGEFYERLVEALKTSGARFATAAEAVTWFARRRAVVFEQRGAAVVLRGEGRGTVPGLLVRVHHPMRGDADATSRPQRSSTDFEWDGASSLELDPSGGRLQKEYAS